MVTVHSVSFIVGGKGDVGVKGQRSLPLLREMERTRQRKPTAFPSACEGIGMIGVYNCTACKGVL